MSFMFYKCAAFNQPLSFTPFLIKISFILYSSFLCKKVLSREEYIKSGSHSKTNRRIPIYIQEYQSFLSGYMS